MNSPTSGEVGAPRFSMTKGNKKKISQKVLNSLLTKAQQLSSLPKTGKTRRARKQKHALRSLLTGESVKRTFGTRVSTRDIVGDSSLCVSNVGNVPAAFSNVVGNSTWLRMEGKVRHPREGDGVVICGCQPFTDIVTTNANNNVFTSGTLATAGNANSIQLSPDNLNGPLAAQANLHQKYVFTDVLLEYVSNVATSQAGSMALSYSMDGSGVAPPTTFSQARQLVPSITFPFRADRAFLHYHYDGPDTFFTLEDNASTAASRWTNQGIINGFPSATSLGNISQGFMNVWYRIELYQPVASQGFTVTLKTQEEREMIRALVRRLFPEKRQQCDAVRVDWDERVEEMLQKLHFSDDGGSELVLPNRHEREKSPSASSRRGR
jgi:hypothetical protein